MEGSVTRCSIVGSSFPYMPWYPQARARPRLVQIDADPTRLGLRYPVEVGLTGDAKATLQALMPKCSHYLAATRTGRSSAKAQEGMKEWRELMEEPLRHAGRLADEAAGDRSTRSTRS